MLLAAIKAVASRLAISRQTAFLDALIVVLLLSSAVYFARGFSFFVSDACDLGLRWQEQQYVFRGTNPLEVMRDDIVAQTGVSRARTPDVDLGPTVGGYPPWAYFTGAAFLWPSNYFVAKWYWAAINTICFAGICVWVYRLGRPYGVRMGILLVAAVVGIRSIYITIGNGQYGIITVAALIAILVFDEKKWRVASGIAGGVAMTKIILAGPFGLSSLILQRWRMIAVMGLYVIAGSCWTWWLTGTNPLEMFLQMLQFGGNRLADRATNTNIWTALVFLGVPAQMALKLGALLAVVFGAVMMYLARGSGMLTLFGIAAYVSRVWTYHHDYDDMVLMFLLVALAVSALRHKSLLCWSAFLLTGVALWPIIPRAVGAESYFLVFQSLAWLFSVIALTVTEAGLLRQGGAVNSEVLLPAAGTYSLGAPVIQSDSPAGAVRKST